MMVPLDQIATITMGKGPRRSSTWTASAWWRSRRTPKGAPRASHGRRMKIAKAIDFPQGYGLTLGGASRDQQEVFREMFIALSWASRSCTSVLVMQFGSFTAPLPVMLSLPLSLIGVVLALLLTKGSLNLMSFIGIIMLMGLVAKNAILLLDCARKEEARGVDREEALMHAGRVRLARSS
jgi:multidrug efflux pump subunit AcrB